MAEYIDREALYQFLTDQKRKETGAYSKGINTGLNVARSALHNKEITPSADVAPVKHGKWKKSDTHKGYCLCSNCEGCYIDGEWADEQKWGYCPNCGAKMDLED